MNDGPVGVVLPGKAGDCGSSEDSSAFAALPLATFSVNDLIGVVESLVDRAFRSGRYGKDIESAVAQILQNDLERVVAVSADAYHFRRWDDVQGTLSRLEEDLEAVRQKQPDSAQDSKSQHAALAKEIERVHARLDDALRSALSPEHASQRVDEALSRIDIIRSQVEDVRHKGQTQSVTQAGGLQDDVQALREEVRDTQRSLEVLGRRCAEVANRNEIVANRVEDRVRESEVVSREAMLAAVQATELRFLEELLSRDARIDQTQTRTAALHEDFRLKNEDLDLKYAAATRARSNEQGGTGEVSSPLALAPVPLPEEIQQLQQQQLHNLAPFHASIAQLSEEVAWLQEQMYSLGPLDALARLPLDFSQLRHDFDQVRRLSIGVANKVEEKSVGAAPAWSSDAGVCDVAARKSPDPRTAPPAHDLSRSLKSPEPEVLLPTQDRSGAPRQKSSGANMDGRSKDPCATASTSLSPPPGATDEGNGSRPSTGKGRTRKSKEETKQQAAPQDASQDAWSELQQLCNRSQSPSICSSGGISARDLRSGRDQGPDPASAPHPYRPSSGEDRRCAGLSPPASAQLPLLGDDRCPSATDVWRAATAPPRPASRGYGRSPSEPSPNVSQALPEVQSARSHTEPGRWQWYLSDLRCEMGSVRLKEGCPFLSPHPPLSPRAAARVASELQQSPIRYPDRLVKR